MKTGFNHQKYIESQRAAIWERRELFSKGKLYFEIGGKFPYDLHASRVLPGYNPKSKLEILRSLKSQLDIIFCINSEDLIRERVWETGDYATSLKEKLNELQKADLPSPKIVFNLYREHPAVETVFKDLTRRGYLTYRRYRIANYPDDTTAIVSQTGFGRDDYIETEHSLIIVIALGSNSGKMSTCLGQIYLDKQHGLDSGYAKYETFPIWDLPLKHPVNLAYEAATVDIGDFNVIDPFHQKAYGVEAVNYNRDVAAFPILQRLTQTIVSASNPMLAYRSPTDMGINMAKQAIIEEDVVITAAIEEIRRRRDYFAELARLGKASVKDAERCEQLLELAVHYREENGSDPHSR